jgi:hypothetical protein
MSFNKLSDHILFLKHGFNLKFHLCVGTSIGEAVREEEVNA